MVESSHLNRTLLGVRKIGGLFEIIVVESLVVFCQHDENKQIVVVYLKMSRISKYIIYEYNLRILAEKERGWISKQVVHQAIYTFNRFCGVTSKRRLGVGLMMNQRVMLWESGTIEPNPSPRPDYHPTHSQEDNNTVRKNWPISKNVTLFIASRSVIETAMEFMTMLPKPFKNWSRPDNMIRLGHGKMWDFPNCLGSLPHGRKHHVTLCF